VRAQVAKLPVTWVATHPREAGRGRWVTPAEAVLPDPQSRQQPELTGGSPCPGVQAALCRFNFSAEHVLMQCLQRASASSCCVLHTSWGEGHAELDLRCASAALLEAGLPLAADVPEAIAAAMLDLTPGARAVHPALVRDHLRAAAWRPCGRRTRPGQHCTDHAPRQHSTCWLQPSKHGMMGWAASAVQPQACMALA